MGGDDILQGGEGGGGWHVEVSHGALSVCLCLCVLSVCLLLSGDSLHVLSVVDCVDVWSFDS